MTDLLIEPETDSRRDEDKRHSSFVRREKNTYVFVLCKCGKPLMPTTSPKARILLKRRKAGVFRLYPFTIRLNYEAQHNTQPVEIRIDYGARTHGIALVQQCRTHDKAVFLGEVIQRQNVKKRMDTRRELRRDRRLRNTRYRKRRFHRRLPQGWVPPTIRQRVETIVRVTKTLNRMSPISDAVVEIGKFDAQKIVNPMIEGIEYQQGLGCGFENKRQATLAYFNYTCQYCGTKKGMMTVDHVIPKAEGGTNIWSNLTCACRLCNGRKGERAPKEAGLPDPRTVNPRNTEFLKFCAIIQSGRTRLINQLQDLMPTNTVYGWQTRQNREVAGLPKTHYFDALCVRSTTGKKAVLTRSVHEIRPRRRNIRQLHQANPRKGGRRTPYNQNKILSGFRKGDLIRTAQGLAYIDSIQTSGKLQYRCISGQRHSARPNRVNLIESMRSIQFFVDC